MLDVQNMPDDRGINMYIIRNPFMFNTLFCGFVRRHADAVANHMSQDLIFPDLRQFKFIEPEIILAVYAYCLGFHNFINVKIQCTFPVAE